MFRSMLASALLALAYLTPVLAGVDNWLSPQYTWLYQFPLPIPPIKTPSK